MIEGEPRTKRRSQAAVHHIFGVRGGIAGTVYGTIVAMATITAGASHGHEPRKLAVLVTSTVIVFWIAHVYSDALAESIELKRKLTWAELMAIERRELAIPLAGAAPVAALLLGAADVLRETTAIWLALAIGLGTLAAQGARYAHVQGLKGTSMLWPVAINLALGLTIIALKIAVGHV